MLGGEGRHTCVWKAGEDEKGEECWWLVDVDPVRVSGSHRTICRPAGLGPITRDGARARAPAPLRDGWARIVEYR
jgi:hypothetical protein